MDILDMPHEDFSDRKQAEVFYKKNKQSGIGICMENVSYAYHTGKQVLNKVDFLAEPGQLTGLVGASAERRQCFVFYCLYLNHSRER